MTEEAWGLDFSWWLKVVKSLILKEGFSKRFFKKSNFVLLGCFSAINSARKAPYFQKAAKDKQMDSANQFYLVKKSVFFHSFFGQTSNPENLHFQNFVFSCLSKYVRNSFFCK
ncbi:MAG: hypothetical protein IPN76_01015 [Saprospiraceae bacterium]|nr:hypothetical protein [Saprospiraceae bacterium]